MNFPAWLPILLGFLTAVGPATTDMYLPAFPAIEASFGARPGSAQLIPSPVEGDSSGFPDAGPI
jgi:hypothetical protein